MTTIEVSEPQRAEGPGAIEPLISVVIASVSGPPSLAECLHALVHQKGDVPFEVLVVDRCGRETLAPLRGLFPQSCIRWRAAARGTSIPQLRALGIGLARGKWVAILEDHCNVVPGWCAAIARAAAAGHQVIGGAVENGCDRRIVDWAVFFCEYARFMPPLARGPAADVTGNNTAYDRRLLLRVRAELDDDLWDTLLHKRLRELGATFYCEPDQVVRHKKQLGFREFLTQRYHCSRAYASLRLARAAWWKRLLYAGATPLLPSLLLARIARTVLNKRRHGATFVRALPLMAAFVVIWAWGEAVGAMRGPGSSLQMVE